MKYVEVSGGRGEEETSGGRGEEEVSGGRGEEEVSAGRGGDPVLLDPRPYLDRLPGLAEGLPPGARAFATDPAHYDFGGRRCVKDLTPVEVSHGADDALEIRFRHDCARHDEDLIIRYSGVSRFQTDVLDACDPASLGAVLLDEILPHPAGCTHELACLPGTLVVACRDLAAQWVPADCPEAGPAR